MKRKTAFEIGPYRRMSPKIGIEYDFILCASEEDETFLMKEQKQK